MSFCAKPFSSSRRISGISSITRHRSSLIDESRLFVVLDGKQDEPFSWDQFLAFFRRDVSVPVGICTYLRAGEAREQAP